MRARTVRNEQRAIDAGQLNFYRDSIAGLCVMLGSTSGRQKRDYERWKAKQETASRDFKMAS